jgi:nucleoside-diphosphate-sugar epimerase
MTTHNIPNPSSPFHVIIGAGPTGSGVARMLAEDGEHVRLVSRRGRGPVHPRIDRIAADATDSARMIELTTGARTLFNCTMPPYDRWPSEFPPIAAALLTAAESTGARYVMLNNAYVYGPVDGPIHEELTIAPTTVKGRVRAQMWLDALASHQAGRVRVADVRPSDYLGEGAVSYFTIMAATPIVAGQPVHYPGDLDAPHSWTYTGDVARTLVAVSRHEEAWGRVWHVPSTTTSVRDLCQRFATIAGVRLPALHVLSDEDLRRAGEADSIIREVVEMLYLVHRPFVLDATRTEQTFGIRATPLETGLAETARELTAIQVSAGRGRFQERPRVR